MRGRVFAVAGTAEYLNGFRNVDQHDAPAIRSNCVHVEGGGVAVIVGTEVVLSKTNISYVWAPCANSWWVTSQDNRLGAATVAVHMAGIGRHAMTSTVSPGKTVK